MPADGRHVACAAPGAAFGARVGAEDFSPMEDADGLCAALQLKLRRWEKLGEAPEYYELRNRGPYKPTVMHEHNRFGGQMGPYEDSLLSLQSVEYINASPIDNAGPGAPRFIATMCPKQTTFAHFWSMVWEIGSTVIVNLTHFKDRVGSEPTDKRERYWPPFDAPSITAQARRWPVIPRTCGCEACEQVPGLQRWAVELTGPPEAGGGARPTRVVTLYWYSRWVDFPSSSSIGSRPFFANAWAVLHLAIHLGALLKRKPDDHWAVCHCSAGVGRTGTLIALLALLCPGGEAPAVGADFDEIVGAFDARVASTIEAMRERRLWMVKTDCECARAAAPPAPSRHPPALPHVPSAGRAQVRDALRGGDATAAQSAKRGLCTHVVASGGRLFSTPRRRCRAGARARRSTRRRARRVAGRVARRPTRCRAGRDARCHSGCHARHVGRGHARLGARRHVC